MLALLAALLLPCVARSAVYDIVSVDRRVSGGLRPIIADAAHVDSLSADSIAQRYDIGAITVSAPRKISDIGIQKTNIEGSVLHESVVASMADILSLNTPVFIKSYGRATLSTASTRGTAPSHTQVTWNGMNINSPMFGMVDFSYIPSHFVDHAAVFYGASSTGATAGGLGGAIVLETKPAYVTGLRMEFTQGISSFRTVDEFLRLDYGGSGWQGSTRAAYASSANDFAYTNYNKKDFIIDDNGKITGYRYPMERNKNCTYNDFHLLQEFSYYGECAGRFSLSAWYMDSSRGIPLLSVDWNEWSSRRARQNDRTLRSVAGWDKSFRDHKVELKAGYHYGDILYVQSLDNGHGIINERSHSQSYVNTFFARAGYECSMRDKLRMVLRMDFHQHWVNTQDEAYRPVSPDKPIGYKEARAELSGFASARYKPVERFGAAVNLRTEMCGEQWVPLIPALFLDYLLSHRGNLFVKASVARNYRFPTLNDLYLRPGGRSTPDLRPEEGFTFDGGMEFRTAVYGVDLSGGITAYDSRIRNWILWRPTEGGYWTPFNVKLVHSYGTEARLAAQRTFRGGWKLSIDGKSALTHSINRGEPVNDADNSVGKQLPYIPKWASSVIGRLEWRRWSLSWHWNYYSERYTSTDNSPSITGKLVPYIMNDISLGKEFSVRWADISIKLNVNNLFGEEYESELARPMPGRNFGFFLKISPRWK